MRIRERVKEWIGDLLYDSLKPVIERAINKQIIPALLAFSKEREKDDVSLLKLLRRSPYIQLSITHPVRKGDQVLVDLDRETVTPIVWAAHSFSKKVFTLYVRSDLPEGVAVPFNLNIHGDPLTVFADSVTILTTRY